MNYMYNILYIYICVCVYANNFYISEYIINIQNFTVNTKVHKSNLVSNRGYIIYLPFTNLF